MVLGQNTCFPFAYLQKGICENSHYHDKEDQEMKNEGEFVDSWHYNPENKMT